MRATLLVMGIAVGLITAPASAGEDLFGFSVSNLHTTFDGTNSFHTLDWSRTVMDVYRNAPPGGAAQFVPMSWGVGSEGFLISMSISSLTATTASGTGTFVLQDIHGDTISGDIGGTWTKVSNGGWFLGSLWNVTFTPVVNDTFDGHSGSVSLVFAAPQPWEGTLIQLNASGAWFQSGVFFDTYGGSLDATISAPAIPAPGALSLCLLGLSALGLKRRKSM